MSSTFILYSRLHVGKNDLLTFYDGDDLTANILGQYSGTRPHFKLYTSMGDVTVQFQSDPATNIYGYNNGFVVHFFGEFFLSYLHCLTGIKLDKNSMFLSGLLLFSVETTLQDRKEGTDE